MPDGGSDDGSFGLVPTDARPQPIRLRPDERTQREADMVYLTPRRPDLTYQIYAHHHLAMLAAPVASHQLDALRIRLGQGGVVQHEQTAIEINHILRFSPQRPRVGRLSREQTGERIVRCLLVFCGLTASGFGATEGSLIGNHKVYVVVVTAVYPRVCGGTGCARSPMPTEPGLSPRVRGNRCPRRRLWSLQRSIPACAGEPRFDKPPTSGYRVYPRVCGGTRIEVLRAELLEGLSPRVRGNRGRQRILSV